MSICCVNVIPLGVTAFNIKPRCDFAMYDIKFSNENSKHSVQLSFCWFWNFAEFNKQTQNENVDLWMQHPWRWECGEMEWCGFDMQTKCIQIISRFNPIKYFSTAQNEEKVEEEKRRNIFVELNLNFRIQILNLNLNIHFCGKCF